MDPRHCPSPQRRPGGPTNAGLVPVAPAPSPPRYRQKSFEGFICWRRQSEKERLVSFLAFCPHELVSIRASYISKYSPLAPRGRRGGELSGWGAAAFGFRYGGIAIARWQAHTDPQRTTCSPETCTGPAPVHPHAYPGCLHLSPRCELPACAYSHGATHPISSSPPQLHRLGHPPLPGHF